MEHIVNHKIPLVEQIEEALSKKGWRPADFARHANVSPSVVSRLFKNSKNISVENLQKILDCLSPETEKNKSRTGSSNEPSPRELLDKIAALEKRFDSYERSTNLTLDLTKMGLESLKDSKKYLEGMLESIDARLEKAGETGDIRLLRRVG